jgi:hypothetical protein
MEAARAVALACSASFATDRFRIHSLLGMSSYDVLLGSSWCPPPAVKPLLLRADIGVPTDPVAIDALEVHVKDLGLCRSRATGEHGLFCFLARCICTSVGSVQL